PVRIQLEDSEISHYYSNYIECRFVVKGHFEMEIDGQIAAFDENEVCFMTSTALHRECLSTSECVLINFNISKSFFTELFLSSLTLSPLQKLLRTNLMQTGQKEKYLRLKSEENDVETIKQYVFTIFDEGIRQRVGYQDICRGYIIRLVDILSNTYRHFSRTESSHYKKALFDEVSTYMEENLSTVTLTELAEAFHYQPNFINNLIKRYTGLTYSGYLIGLRIEHAKILLETTDLSIEEIIWLVGYHNRGFFYRKFTEITSVSPSSYRRSKR
ncbi:MAG: helix-turn-helix domain-containing protein, partial [Oscillospiraceae bacterium]|nr:helix-turn-helix domain-containing protein [Oscillospiraceae bacterium]